VRLLLGYYGSTFRAKTFGGKGFGSTMVGSTFRAKAFGGKGCGSTFRAVREYNYCNKVFCPNYFKAFKFRAQAIYLHVLKTPFSVFKI
jgi:hypothetical protein